MPARAEELALALEGRGHGRGCAASESFRKRARLCEARGLWFSQVGHNQTGFGHRKPGQAAGSWQPSSLRGMRGAAAKLSWRLWCCPGTSCSGS